MSNTILTVPPKVALLIPLLGSEHDGEVVGAARAIARTLRAAGCDWHDLVKIIVAPPIAAAHPQASTDTAYTPHDVATWCHAHNSRLSDREKTFVRDMVGRSMCGGGATEKQSAWLRAIFIRLRRSGNE